MRPNRLRARFASGETAIGAWLSIPSSVSAEAVASGDYDYVCIDMQHGLIDHAQALPMLQALTTGTATAAARVLENQPGHIGKALDAGAMAVIVPMVNTAAQSRAAIDAARYTPEGSRSYGPTRVGQVEGPDYFERANREVTVIPMIETAEAVDNIDDILGVPGVEAIYVGPADLAVSLGFPPDSEEAGFLRVLDDIVAACRRHDVVPGIHTAGGNAGDRLERGFRMITVTSDLRALRDAVQRDLRAVGRAGAGESSLY